MRRAAIAIPISLWSSLALAGGFEYPDVGTVAMGRGAAFAAKADDGTALYYNPAGLADQDGWRVTLDLTIGDQQTTFQRQDPTTGANVGPQISNLPGVFLLPFVAVSRGFDLGFFGKLAVAAGIVVPPANGAPTFPGETPPALTVQQKAAFGSNCLAAPAPASCPGASTSTINTAPQKYMGISEAGLIFYPTLSAAWQPIPLIAVGAGLQLIVSNLALQQATFDGAATETGGHSPNNEQLTYDSLANVSVSGLTVAANFGIKLRPIAGLSIGASYKPKATITQSGTLTLNFSPLAQALNARVTGAGTTNSADGSTGSGPTTLQNVFPGELKTGIDYDFGLFDLEADFNWTQWSQFQQAVITPSFGEASGPTTSASTPVPQLISTNNFQDTWSVRLGGEGKLPISVVRASIRAGIGYESSVYNDSATQYVTLNYANFDSYWGAVGATVGIGPADISLTYSHVYMPQKTVTNSGVTAQENNAPAGTTPFVVGDGKFNTAYDLLALGVKAHF